VTKTINMSWLPSVFDRDLISSTHTTIVCCDAREIPSFHASALEFAKKYRYIVVDVALGEDPREAMFRTVGRETNVAVAVEAHLKKTKRDIVVIVRDAARFANDENGLAILWSLKSARDRVDPRLRLLFFGTDRAALQTFVSPKAAPFFGSYVIGEANG
jgi:hypothetical protein